MFGFVLRLAIAVPLFAALLGLSVLALILEVLHTSHGRRPSPRDLIANYVNRG